MRPDETDRSPAPQPVASPAQASLHVERRAPARGGQLEASRAHGRRARLAPSPLVHRSSTRPRPWAALSALLALLAAPGALAAKPSPTPKPDPALKPTPAAAAKPKADPAAEALLKKGVELRKKGKDAEALEAFRAAYERAPSPRALAQIGLAEQALGAWLDAEEHVAKALEAAADLWISEHRTTLDDALGRIRAHVGRLDVTTNVPGARLWVDGADQGALPLAAPLRHLTGPARLRVEADGHAPRELEVTVPANEVLATRVELVPLVPKVDPALAAAKEAELARTRAELARSTSRPLRPWAWTALGGAALGLGAGVGALVVRNGHVATYNDDVTCLPPNGLTREENCASERSAAESAQTLATIGFAAGGALAVTGALLFLLDGPSDDAPRPHAALGPGPGDVGLALTMALP